MKRLSTLLLLLVLPVGALAYDFSNRATTYVDAPFSTSEAAGIGLLTEIGAVEGNPDGTFAPQRTLNRAEFLKIALASNPNVRVAAEDAGDCFPDVKATDWFSRYVCLAKVRDIIEGYPDGTFKPAQPVNYVEALKILAELYEHPLDGYPTEPWYQKYVSVATDLKTILPINLSFDHQLTRGQMARLAAAYRAESDGLLTQYRQAERGETVTSSSASSASSESSVSSESGAVMSSSSSLSSTGATSSSVSSEAMSSGTYMISPAVSQQLVVGTVSPKPVASAYFGIRSSNTLEVRFAEIKLDEEVRSVNELHLVTASGQLLGVLTKDYLDEDNVTYRFSAPESDIPTIPGSLDDVPLYIFAKINSMSTFAIPGELMRVEEAKMTIVDTGTDDSQILYGRTTTYPRHKITGGTLTAVEALGTTTGTLLIGPSRLIGQFSFSGSSMVTDGILLESVRFDYDAPYGVSIKQVRLQRQGGGKQLDCYFASGVKAIDCPAIPAEIGLIENGEAAILELYADIGITVSGGSKTLQLRIDEAGSLEDSGVVLWNDGSISHGWVTLPSPLAIGTFWTIEE